MHRIRRKSTENFPEKQKYLKKTENFQWKSFTLEIFHGRLI